MIVWDMTGTIRDLCMQDAPDLTEIVSRLHAMEAGGPLLLADHDNPFLTRPGIMGHWDLTVDGTLVAMSGYTDELERAAMREAMEALATFYNATGGYLPNGVAYGDPGYSVYAPQEAG